MRQRVEEFLGGLLAMLLAGAASAAEGFAPYVADEHTLHLWHLDEAGIPFVDQGLSPTPLLGLLKGAEAGHPTLPGFGSAVSFATPREKKIPGKAPHGPILLAKPQLNNGPLDNVDWPFPIMGANGAFTMEALVKLDLLPNDSASLAADIFGMDDENRENRVFLFRIEKPGFVSFVPISGSAVRGGGLATIPTDGPHAINTRDWFHVAVTYDGVENAPNNLKLYWTRMGAGAEVANLIGSGTLSTHLSRKMGDFAIGNSGSSSSLGPWEYFPGSLDEVRISSVAREPHDFFFASEGARRQAQVPVFPLHPPRPEVRMRLQQVLVGDVPVAIPEAGVPLVVGSGLHRLDFDFGFPAGVSVDPLAVRCRLEGLDEEWQPAARGMTLTWEMLDAAGGLLARTVYSATGASAAWERDISDSPLQGRREPLFVPERTRRIRITLASGTADTTGSWVIDELALRRPSNMDLNLWENGRFLEGERMNQIGGVPKGWLRRGSEPAIARVVLRGDSTGVGLLDAEQYHSAMWTSTQELRVTPALGGETFLATWREAYNVIPGASLRATYMNVPPGTYTFRAVAAADEPVPATAHLVLPLTVRQPFWRQAWFAQISVAGGVLVVAAGFFVGYRRHARHRLAAVKLQNALERDRARIARDMHDDLGTRVSVLNLTASFVRNSIDRDPQKARGQVVRLERAARDLVQAMEGLVWAVNPENDTLDHVAAHLAGVAHDLFRDSPARLRLSIPTDLPAIPLRSDFRHHFALSVKEALHNVLKHAGACEVTFRLHMEGNQLVAILSDTGTGFDPNHPREGNGLRNLAARLDELGGSCDITSAPGVGTTVTLRCHLGKPPAI